MILLASTLDPAWVTPDHAVIERGIQDGFEQAVRLGRGDVAHPAVQELLTPAPDLRPSCSLPIVQLAATASRSPFGRRTRSATPNLDPVTTHQGFGACEQDGEK